MNRKGQITLEGFFSFLLRKTVICERGMTIKSKRQPSQCIHPSQCMAVNYAIISGDVRGGVKIETERGTDREKERERERNLCG